MPRYKIIIEYEGTDFCGWQFQTNGRSIQQTIEQAIANFAKQHIAVIGAGRTDAGVHATGQVAHFDLLKPLMPYAIMQAINHFLRPYPIRIQECSLVDQDFHARFSAIKRYYKYRIINRPGPPAIGINSAWHIKFLLNVQDMLLAKEYLIGQHDFTSFRAIKCQANSPVKTIDTIDIVKEVDYIELKFSAVSYLHHMIRNITGALVAVGLNKLTPGDIVKILQAKNRQLAPATAPAHGLYFSQVDY